MRNLRFLAALFCAAVVMPACFAEHVISVSPRVGLDGVRFSLDDDTDLGLLDINFALAASYEYVFRSGLMLGLEGSVGYSGAVDTLIVDPSVVGASSSDDITVSVSADGFSFGASPVIGWRAGRRHLITFALLPVSFDYVSVPEMEREVSFDAGKLRVKQDVKYGRDLTLLSTGVRAGFQWGNGLVRHGFTVGFGLPWYAKGSFRFGDVSGDKEKSGVSGANFFIGYRCSFVPGRYQKEVREEEKEDARPRAPQGSFIDGDGALVVENRGHDAEDYIVITNMGPEDVQLAVYGWHKRGDGFERIGFCTVRGYGNERVSTSYDGDLDDIDSFRFVPEGAAGVVDYTVSFRQDDLKLAVKAVWGKNSAVVDDTILVPPVIGTVTSTAENSKQLVLPDVSGIEGLTGFWGIPWGKYGTERNMAVLAMERKGWRVVSNNNTTVEFRETDHADIYGGVAASKITFYFSEDNVFYRADIVWEASISDAAETAASLVEKYGLKRAPAKNDSDVIVLNGRKYGFLAYEDVNGNCMHQTVSSSGGESDDVLVGLFSLYEGQTNNAVKEAEAVAAQEEQQKRLRQVWNGI